MLSDILNRDLSGGALPKHPSVCLIMPLRVSVLQGVYSDVVFWCYSEGKGIISKLVDLLVKA